jgi:hypothetical protein
MHLNVKVHSNQNPFAIADEVLIEMNDHLNANNEMKCLNHFRVKQKGKQRVKRTNFCF